MKQLTFKEKVAALEQTVHIFNDFADTHGLAIMGSLHIAELETKQGYSLQFNTNLDQQ